MIFQGRFVFIRKKLSAELLVKLYLFASNSVSSLRFGIAERSLFVMQRFHRIELRRARRRQRAEDHAHQDGHHNGDDGG